VIEQWIANHLRPIVDSLLYSVIGTLILVGCFWVIHKLLPFSMTKEIAEDQNVGLGIILGALIIGISMIISAAIRG
jgi:putative membrane protein